MTVMTATRKLEAQISDLWTVIDLERKFRVTNQTILNWRNRLDLPTVCIRGDARPALRFVPADVRRWAQQHDIELHEDE